MIQKALELIIRFFLIQIMPFLRWVNSKPALEVSISTKERTQNIGLPFLIMCHIFESTERPYSMEGT
jgi:hypothetical protein